MSVFLGLMRRADLMLDTIGFSGFVTAMHAVESGLPFITCQGKFMRGRFGSGILREIGLDDLVASDDRAYVDLAVAVASNTGRRTQLRRIIADRRDVLFKDIAPVRAFEDKLFKLADH